MDVLAQMTSPPISTTSMNPCTITQATINNPPPSLTPISSSDPSATCGDAGGTDATHQERMEYIRQLVQEREALAGTPGTENARRLLEQGEEKKTKKTQKL